MSARHTSEFAGRRYQHQKTGGHYDIVCIGKLEAPILHATLATDYEAAFPATLEATGQNAFVFRSRRDGSLLLVGPEGSELLGHSVVVYRAMTDRRAWVRAEDLFFDGRFVEVNAADGAALLPARAA